MARSNSKRGVPDPHLGVGTTPHTLGLTPLGHIVAMSEDLGFHIFRLSPGSKSPLRRSKGVWDATDKTNVVLKWFDTDKGYNVGVATGHNGLIVIDIDVKGERDGLRTLNSLQAEHGALPRTLSVTTPSGGKHLYFHTDDPDSIRSTANKLGDGIDVRSTGGYVVAPPSTIGDRQYRWDDFDVPIADLPPKWAELLATATFRPKGGRGQTTVADDDNWSMADAEEMLEHVDADLDHDDWLRVGFALYNKFGDDAFDLWDSWSRRGAKYTKGETTKRWKSFERSDTNAPATMGTLVYLAREGGWSKTADITAVYRMMKSERPWRSVAHRLSRFGLPAPKEGEIAGDIAKHYGVAPEDILTYIDERRQPDDPTDIPWTAIKKDGSPLPTPVNVSLAIMRGLATSYRLEYDTFLNQVLINGEIMTDNHITEFRTTIERMFGFVPPKNDTYDEMLRVAAENERDCLMDYLDALPPPTGEAFPEFMALLGIDPTAIACSMMHKFLIGMVARAYAPGQKMDTALVLIGRQGTHKSALFRALCPHADWFGDNLRALSTKDDLMQLAGKWVIELAELSAIRRQTAEEVKHFLSLRTDEYRPPYGRTVRTFPRRCAFGGTNNEVQFLTDTTGNRRFWPIMLEPGSRPIYWLEANRQHLWADIVAAYRGGAKWWMEEAEAVAAENSTSDFRLDHPWVEPILDACAGHSCFKTSYVLEEVLGMEQARIKQNDSIIVHKILRSMGFEYKQVWVGSSRTKGDASKHKLWVNPDTTIHEAHRTRGVYIGGDI